MPSERRFNEQEIVAIFKEAADLESSGAKIPQHDGLTLEEISEIGQEAGIAPELILRAAVTIDRKAKTPPPIKFMGMPISAARTIELPGPFSDEDWNTLVADLHDTVQGTGRISRNGALRQWHYGSLELIVEPMKSGHRLRIKSVNETSRFLVPLGMIFTLMGLFFILMLALKGDFPSATAKSLFVSMFALIGLGTLGAAAFKIPRWQAKQEHLLNAITKRVTERSGIKSLAIAESIKAGSEIDVDQVLDLVPDNQPLAQKKTRT